MKITLKALSGKSLHFNVEGTTTLNELLEQLSAELSEPADSLKMVFSGKKLVENLPLEKYGIVCNVHFKDI